MACALGVVVTEPGAVGVVVCLEELDGVNVGVLDRVPFAEALQLGRGTGVGVVVNVNVVVNVQLPEGVSLLDGPGEAVLLIVCVLEPDVEMVRT